MSKKNNSSSWSPELPPAEFSETRTAAAAWIYALRYWSDQDISLFKPLLSEIFPHAKLDQVFDIIRRHAPYQDITDELVREIIDCTHSEGYEILPWRESVLSILCIDFLSELKSSSTQLIEDAIIRVTSILDDKLRGTTKNACQIISGLRTRMRKSMRMLVLSALYLTQYRPGISLEEAQNDIMSLVKSCPDTEFIVDNFPFEEYILPDGSFNARGRFAFCEALKQVRAIKSHQDELDELIQKSSKRWRISRMSLIDLNILRLAAYELFFERQSPPRILINEAVELAKCFGAEQSKNFVNGILQQLCNDNQLAIA